ncbi:hypothetical protein ACWD0J_16985 [Streptomyces sp. NPDC003011]
MTAYGPLPSTVIAVDPPGCGCTECMTGEYVPLHRATPDQVASLLNGKLHNNLHSGTKLLVNVVYEFLSPGGTLTVQTVVVTFHNEYDDRYSALSWELTADQLPTG